MALDFDTFLVALYTIVDDLYREHFAPMRPNRPGPKVRLSDSEVLTIVLAGQYLGVSEQELVRHAHTYWKGYFPNLVCQSQTNRRIRDLSGCLVHLVGLLASTLGSSDSPYQVLDSLPVPLMKRCRGDDHKLFGQEASIGKGGSDRDFYYGCQLLTSVSREGVLTGFLLGPASTEIHWLAEAFLGLRADPYSNPALPADFPKPHRGGYVGPTGPIWPADGAGAFNPQPYLGDGGFRGRHWQEHWRCDYQARLLTPETYGHSRQARAEHARWRQVIERTNELLTEAFHLPFPKAKTTWGLRARIAAKLAAYNLGIYINRLFGRPDLALATIFS